jgi:hypothetical protein
MKNRISRVLTGAALLTMIAAAGASAQTTPVVATITVPVTISSMDAEWAKGRFGSISVTCDVSSSANPEPGEHVVARGSELIPLAETTASTTARAMFSYSGSLIVVAHAPARKSGDKTTDAETAAQNSDQ